MRDISEFKIGVGLDLSKLEEQLGELEKLITDRLLGQLQKSAPTFSDLSETISESAITLVEDIRAGAGTLVQGFLTVAGLVLFAIEAYKAAVESIRGIADLFKEEEKKAIDIEKRIEALEKKVQDDISALLKRKELREQLGDEKFFEAFGRIPSDDLTQEQIIDSFQPVLDRIKAIREEFEFIKAIIELSRELTNNPENPNIDNVLETIKQYRKEIDPLNDSIDNWNKVINNNSQSLLQNEKAQSVATKSSEEFTQRANKLSGELQNQGNIIITNADSLSAGEAGWIAYGGAMDVTSDASGGVLSDVSKLNKEGVVPLNNNIVEIADRNKEWADSQGEVNDVVADTKPAIDQATEGVEGYQDALDQVDQGGGFFQGIKDGFVEFAQSVESNSELIADFFANTLSQMSKNFSDLFFNILTGRFDNLKDLAKQTFEAILKSFLDLVAAIATRQIVISIAGALGINTGGAKATDIITGGAKAAADIAGSVGTSVAASPVVIAPTSAQAANAGAIPVGGLGGGAKSVNVPTTPAPTGIPLSTKIGGGLAIGGAVLAGIGSQIGGAGGSILSAAGTVASLTGAGLTIGGPIGAAIGGAVGLVLSIGGLLGAFKKKPRLDLDFDTIRDEFGETTGEAAKVLDFLNEDLFNDRIFSRSVSRKAKLGLGDRLPDVIREAIEGQIRAIQDIIFQLPSDLATQLNESLLNTSVDIESEVRGDRLLEFDDTGKNIAEEFKKFIEGDLQARFIFSIREFFVGAFESLGAIPEAAQAFVDQQFEEFQNVSGREADVVSLDEVRKGKSKNIRCLEEEYRLAA